jgi:hypothetical protein
MLPNPKGERTGKTRTEPTSITPIDLESGRGYDGPGALLTRYGNADVDAVVLSNAEGAAWPVMAELNRRFES